MTAHHRRAASGRLPQRRYRAIITRELLREGHAPGEAHKLARSIRIA